jgi:hypothetical protein
MDDLTRLLNKAERHWAFARAWLYRDVTRRQESSGNVRNPEDDAAG